MATLADLLNSKPAIEERDNTGLSRIAQGRSLRGDPRLAEQSTFNPRKFISDEEGFFKRPTKDSVGVLTLGSGLNLEEKSIRDRIPQDVLDGKRDFTQKENDIIFNERLEIAEEDAMDFAGGEEIYEGLSEKQQTALISVSLNLGKTRLNKFEKMRDALRAGDMQGAVRELNDSKRAKQLPNRTKRESQLLLGE
jgi:GH24 family phage-related lysozyme (muramidase)